MRPQGARPKAARPKRFLAALACDRYEQGSHQAQPCINHTLRIATTGEIDAARSAGQRTAICPSSKTMAAAATVEPTLSRVISNLPAIQKFNVRANSTPKTA